MVLQSNDVMRVRIMLINRKVCIRSVELMDYIFCLTFRQWFANIEAKYLSLTRYKRNGS